MVNAAAQIARRARRLRGRPSGARTAPMNNATAAVLALALMALFALDWLMNDGLILTFLGRRLIGLTERLAFWR